MSRDAITFSELRKIQKEESRQDGITDLDRSFVPSVRDYLKTKKEMSGEGREYKNAKRVFEKIMSMRRRKIMKEAQICSKSSMEGSVDALLPEEQEFFREAVNMFQESQEGIEEKVFSGETPEREDIGVDEDEEGDEVEGEDVGDSVNVEEGDVEEVEEDGSYMKVEIQSDVPEFMGTDLESYGPFEEGEKVEMPEENAEILVNRGNAEVVE